MNLSEAKLGTDVIVKEVITDDEDLKGFLFSLGCLCGETITVVSKRRGGYVLSIKDARYNIDKELAQSILVS